MKRSFESLTPLVNSNSDTAKDRVTTYGLGGSAWKPPDWAVDPRKNSFHLEVTKDGKVIDNIPLEKKRLVFGRQFTMCDIILDHPSISRQHAVIVHHKNGRIFVADLDSAHGTFVSNERLSKNSPTELEPGQSLRFAASSRIYILRKNQIPLFSSTKEMNIDFPPPPDKNNLDAVVEYNTMLNKLGISGTSMIPETSVPEKLTVEPHGKKQKLDRDNFGSKKKKSVMFMDQCGGTLETVLGYSDGNGTESTVGPVKTKEGSSLIGKFDTLVKSFLLPKTGQGTAEIRTSPQNDGNGISENLKTYLEKLRSSASYVKDSLYGGIFGEEGLKFPGGKWGKMAENNEDGGEKEKEEKKSTLNTTSSDYNSPTSK